MYHKGFFTSRLKIKQMFTTDISEEFRMITSDSYSSWSRKPDYDDNKLVVVVVVVNF